MNPAEQNKIRQLEQRIEKLESEIQWLKDQLSGMHEHQIIETIRAEIANRKKLK
jgi:hypothetical protein